MIRKLYFLLLMISASLISSANNHTFRIVDYKGQLIVNELRKMLGDENWESFIKTFYSLYKDKYATYDDFIQTLSVYDQKGFITKSLNNYLSTKGFKEL